MEQEGTKATAWLNLEKAMASNRKLSQDPPMTTPVKSPEQANQQRTGRGMVSWSWKLWADNKDKESRWLRVPLRGGELKLACSDD